MKKTKSITNKVDIAEIRALITNDKILDEKVKEKINSLFAETISAKESREIIFFLKEKRPKLFTEWYLDIASKYM
jgi:ketol-acid reductoisomerase